GSEGPVRERRGRGGARPRGARPGVHVLGRPTAAHRVPWSPLPRARRVRRLAGRAVALRPLLRPRVSGGARRALRGPPCPRPAALEWCEPAPALGRPRRRLSERRAGFLDQLAALRAPLALRAAVVSGQLP